MKKMLLFGLLICSALLVSRSAVAYQTFPPVVSDVKATNGVILPTGKVLVCSAGICNNTLTFRVNDPDSATCSYGFYVLDKKGNVVDIVWDQSNCSTDGRLIAAHWYPKNVPVGMYQFEVFAQDTEGNLSRPALSNFVYYL